jgi:hypothetical protein
MLNLNTKFYKIYGSSLSYASCVSCSSVNKAVCTTIISTNKKKSILTYQHLFIRQRYIATCLDLRGVIIRRNYKNLVLVPEFCKSINQRVIRVVNVKL